MSGTIAGGKKAAATNKIKHGKDFYAEIGRKGGRNGHTGGFASERVGKDGLTGSERAKEAGAKGGRKSKRGPGKAPRSDKGVKRTNKTQQEKGTLLAWLFGRKEK